MQFPSDGQLRWLVQRYATVVSRGLAPNGSRALVLPNGQFFPDDFDGDAGSVNLLFWRLQQHSELTHLEVELHFVDDRHEHDSRHAECCSGRSCTGTNASESCHFKQPLDAPPPVIRLPDAYRVDVLLSQTRTAVTLTSYLATALARIELEQTGGLDEFPANEQRPICELGAIGLGFGVLLANASHVFSKSCGGVSVQRNTSLSVMETALGLAMFLAAPLQPKASLHSLLEPTQRSALSEAKSWTASNMKLLKRLYRDPKHVMQDEMLELSDAKSWLTRVLSFGNTQKRSDDLFDELASQSFKAKHKQRINARQSRKNTPDPQTEQLRRWVQESFEQVKASRDD